MTYLDRNGSLAEFEAIRLLRREGYHVVRTYGHSVPPQLFVGCENDIFFLMVRSVGFVDPEEWGVSCLFAKDLRQFRDCPALGSIAKEFWVLTPPGRWTHFEVLADGILDISREWVQIGTNGGIPWKTTRRAESLPGGRSLYFRRRERALMRAIPPGFLQPRGVCL